MFDVHETLSDMAPIAARFAEIGAPRQLAPLWFAGLLRDGFARTVAGASERFAVLGDGALRTVLHGVELDRDRDDAIAHVLAGIAQLSVHPRCPAGIRALRAGARRLVTLSNGAAEVAQRLLERAGLRDEFETLVSVEDARVCKPHPEAYAYAARTCGTEPANMMLVAVHPWDIDGGRPRRSGHRVDQPHQTALPRLLPGPRSHRDRTGPPRGRPCGLSTHLPRRSPGIAGTVYGATAIRTDGGSRVLTTSPQLVPQPGGYRKVERRYRVVRGQFDHLLLRSLCGPPPGT